MNTQLDDTVWHRARAAWPSLDVARGAFAEYLRERAEGTLDELQLGDLYLACACHQGDEQAIAAFRDRFGGAIRHAVSKAAPAGLGDEITQRVLTKLFVGDGDRSGAIARYGGRGKLSTWVQIVARREASNAVRSERQHHPDRARAAELLLTRAVLADDPELAGLKDRFRDAFKQAFADALSQLSARERNLLRYECLEQLTREQIAQLYGVSVKTVSRWRASCRSRLSQLTRQRFAAHAGVHDEDLDSAMRLIHSQIELSLSRLLPARAKR